MDLNYAPPLLSRILLAVSALILVGVVFVFVSRALEQTPSEAILVQRRAQSFNPKADVSKNPVFPQLQTAYMQAVPDLPMGRDNPFLAPGMVAATSGAILAPNKMLPKTTTSTPTL